eukprot:SAG31_NODE_122_length_23797_cov_39.343812_14_plen_191_part_00
MAGPGPVYRTLHTYDRANTYAWRYNPRSACRRARPHHARELDATAFWCARRPAASAGRDGRFEVRGTRHCWGAILSLQARAPGRMGRGRRRRGPAHLGARVDLTRGSARSGGRVPIVDGTAPHLPEPNDWGLENSTPLPRTVRTTTSLHSLLDFVYDDMSDLLGNADQYSKCAILCTTNHIGYNLQSDYQ